jgi:hypothetical protein
MDFYKTAILRILFKRQQNSIKLSDLVDGFPDEGKKRVLSSILDLQLLGYITLYDSQSNDKHILLNKFMKKEVLHLIDAGLNISNQNIPENVNDNKIQLRKNKVEDLKSKKRYAGLMVTKTKMVVGAIFILSGIALGLVIATYNQVSQTDPLQNYSLHVIQKNVQNIPAYYLTNDISTDLILVSSKVADPDILTVTHIHPILHPILHPISSEYFQGLELFNRTNHENSFVISLSEPDFTKSI